MTYSHSGRIAFSASNVIVIDMPVAKGSTIKSLTKLIPHNFRRQYFVIAAVSFTIKLDPMAFGYKAFTSPLRPIPCAKPKFLSLTSVENTLPSRSPTPQLPSKLLLSISASLSSKYFIF